MDLHQLARQCVKRENTRNEAITVFTKQTCFSRAVSIFHINQAVKLMTYQRDKFPSYIKVSTLRVKMNNRVIPMV